jgi:hypothetical protein
MMQPKICEVCGGEVEFRREGSVQGFFCKSCDWSLVTTYIPEIELDETVYQVYVSDSNFRDEHQVRAVSEISGLNFLSVRKLLQQEHPMVFEGAAPKVLQALAMLEAVRLRYEIQPPFRWKG